MREALCRLVEPRDGAEDVDLQGAAILVEGVFVGCEPRHDAGGVDDQVEAAEVPADAFQQPGHLVVRGHVVHVEPCEVVGRAGSIDGVGDPAKLLFPPRDERHPTSLPSELAGNCGTDAGRGSDNDRVLPGGHGRGAGHRARPSADRALNRRRRIVRA